MHVHVCIHTAHVISQVGVKLNTRNLAVASQIEWFDQDQQSRLKFKGIAPKMKPCVISTRCVASFQATLLGICLIFICKSLHLVKPLYIN